MRYRLWTNLIGLALAIATLDVTVAADSARDLSYVEYSEKDECVAVKAGFVQNSELVLHSVLPLPNDFKGNVVYEPSSNRLFGVSLGPPANGHRVSRLYEFELRTGTVIAEAALPLVGTFGNAVYRDGYLYQPVPHESRLYKISVRHGDFGRIAEHQKLPTILDLKLGADDLLRFTFIAFTGMAWTPNRNLMIHSEDLGELITINPTDGSVVSRVSTERALRGITAAVSTSGGAFLLLANADPADARRKIEERRFMFRGIHGVFELTPKCFPAGVRALHWVLLDPNTGKVLSRTLPRLSHSPAGSVSFMRHEPVQGTIYGRYYFVTTGIDGIEILSWTPVPADEDSTSSVD